MLESPCSHKQQNEGISRRGLVKASLLAGAGVLGSAVLSACSPESPGNGNAGGNTPVEWDKTADIVVVGTGTACVAIVAAAHYGAEKVIALEKSALFGGTSAMSGGGVAIPLTHIATANGIQDNLEDVLKYYRAASAGRADLDVAKNYIANGDKYLTWAEDYLGVTWDFGVSAGAEHMYQDYYEPCEGFLEWGRGNIGVRTIDGEVNTRIAAGYWEKMRSVIDADEKVELLMETAATELVTDGNGKVIGVVAQDRNGTVRIGASKGVILGTGGFEHDPEMRGKYLPYPLLAASSVDTNTGDGQKMGMRIGADLSNMDKNWGLPHFLMGGENALELLENFELVQDFAGQDAGMYRGLPGSVVVNKKGQRFGNESAAYPVFNKAFGNFDNYTASFVNIPGYLICDSTYVGVYRLPGQAKATDPVPDTVSSANTLEELAGKLNIDPEGLVAEIAEFNANAKNGTDPKFNRGGHRFDINTSAVYSGMRTDLPNPCLSPLETGPFYGVPIVPGTFGTGGGLKVDANSQVVNVVGETIAGLYAVGNCSSGVSAGTYMAGGMTIGQGSVMSWVAVRHILGVSD
jgi:succinate dehydrogenase/fumarate reductase flavoprotein subunit